MVQDILSARTENEISKYDGSKADEPPISNLGFWVIVATFLVMLGITAGAILQLESFM